MHTSQKCVVTSASEHNVGVSPKSPLPEVTKAQNLLVILTRAVSPLHFKRKQGPLGYAVVPGVRVAYNPGRLLFV